MSRLILMSQAVVGAGKQLEIGCRRDLVQNYLYNTVGPDVLWNIFTVWLITFNRNSFDAPVISMDVFVYICDVTLEVER